MDETSVQAIHSNMSEEYLTLGSSAIILSFHASRHISCPAVLSAGESTVDWHAQTAFDNLIGLILAGGVASRRCS